MYNVAVVTDEKCVAKKGCRLCIMYCPEADCILLDTKNMVAKVVTDICKGCELCKVVCDAAKQISVTTRSEEHTSELQSRLHLVCRLLLEKKNHSLALKKTIYAHLLHARTRLL